MQFFHSNNSSYTHTIFQNPDWKRILEWMQNEAPTAGYGIHNLDGKRLYVSVESYDTLLRHECRFESHRRYIDVQFCLEGGEWIDWTPLDKLSPNGPYDDDRDLLFHYKTSATLSLPMTAGAIAVFDPTDGHRPKVRMPGHLRVKKAVAKWQI